MEDYGYNYTLPIDPCEYDTINVTWVIKATELESLLSLITKDNYIVTSCYLIIQEPLKTELEILNITYLINYNYWFGDYNFTNNNSGYDINDYTGKCNITTKKNGLNCVNGTNNNHNISLGYVWEETDDGCYYPFVKGPKNYKTDYLTNIDDSLDYCGVPCEFDLYKGNIQDLVKFLNYNRN